VLLLENNVVLCLCRHLTKQLSAGQTVSVAYFMHLLLLLFASLRYRFSKCKNVYKGFLKGIKLLNFTTFACGCSYSYIVVVVVVSA